MSIVRAPGDGPHPRRPWGSERKKRDPRRFLDSLISVLSGARDITTLLDYMHWSAQ